MLFTSYRVPPHLKFNVHEVHFGWTHLSIRSNFIVLSHLHRWNVQYTYRRRATNISYNHSFYSLVVLISSLLWNISCASKKQMECFIFLSVVVGPTFNIIHGSHFVTPFPKTKAFISCIFLLSDVFNVLFCYSLVTFVVVAQKVAQNSHQLIKPSHVYKHFFDKSNLIRMGFPTTALSTH